MLAELGGVVAKEIAGVFLPAPVQLFQPPGHRPRQLDGVHGGEQFALQRLQPGPLPEAIAPVENGIALPSGGHQAGVGEHLEVVTESGLANVEDGTQLGYPEGVLPQHPQYLQAQWVGAGLAESGQGGQLQISLAGNGLGGPNCGGSRHWGGSLAAFYSISKYFDIVF